ncbi:MAG: FliA/WhiG family RNA polymerase sigma factor [Fervidobacterium sp.]|jgi:RNA polymerase sigma factor for flagellar operon FliA
MDKENIVKQYLPLIVRIARDLKVNLPYNVELDDLIQEGVIALLQAVEKYDPRHGATFKTFAYTRIKGAMLDYLRRIDYLPKNVRQDIKRLDREILNFYDEYNRFPSYDEMAERLGMSSEDVKEIYSELALKQYLNLDQYLFESEEISYAPIEVKSEENVKENAWKSILYEQLIEAINKLDDKEKMMLSMRYEHELSLKEIAEVFGVTESRVSQIITGVLSKLRKMLRGDEYD